MRNKSYLKVVKGSFTIIHVEVIHAFFLGNGKGDSVGVDLLFALEVGVGQDGHVENVLPLAGQGQQAFLYGDELGYSVYGQVLLYQSDPYLLDVATQYRQQLAGRVFLQDARQACYLAKLTLLGHRIFTTFTVHRNRAIDTADPYSIIVAIKI